MNILFDFIDKWYKQLKLKWLFFVTAVTIFTARDAAKGARTPAPALSALTTVSILDGCSFHYAYIWSK